MGKSLRVHHKTKNGYFRIHTLKINTRFLGKHGDVLGPLLCLIREKTFSYRSIVFIFFIEMFTFFFQLRFPVLVLFSTCLLIIALSPVGTFTDQNIFTSYNQKNVSNVDFTAIGFICIIREFIANCYNTA